MKLPHLYKFFRKAWSREAAYFLVLSRVHPDPLVRLGAVLRLVEGRVPLTGAFPSMGFDGLPYRNLSRKKEGS
jgi:hypothetical protein